MNNINDIILPADKDSIRKKTAQNNITSEQFESIMQQVYEIMLHFSRIRGELLTKDNPMYIGNISFWFHHDPDTGEESIKFNQPVGLWREDDLYRDINLHFHNLFYGQGVD